MTSFSTRDTYFGAFLTTIILLGVTFYLQKYDGFVPCPLCILQRFALGILGLGFLSGWIFYSKKSTTLIICTLSTAFALAGIFLSGRQVWLQHLPPDKNADCGVSLQYLINALPFDQVIAKVMRGTAECSQKGWEFLHMSLAEWSLICFLGFLLVCLYQLKEVVFRNR
jgi:disulfide bond formation protein DsbB